MKKRLFTTLLVAMLMPFVMQAQNNPVGILSTADSCGSYTWSVNGQRYTASGIYTHASGDTIYTLNLTIYPVYETAQVVENITACSFIFRDTLWNDSHTSYSGINNDTVNTSGIHNHTYRSSHKCDSVAAINLTLATTATKSYVETRCAEYEWHGLTFNRDTVITNKTFEYDGCDSILSLDLTILTPTTISTDTFLTNCGTLLFRFDQSFPARVMRISTDSTFTTEDLISTPSENKVFHPRESVQAQCFDSIRTAHITINEKKFTTSNVTACDQYILEYYKVDSTGAVSDTVTKVFSSNTTNDTTIIGKTVDQCDSAVILNVTINKSPLPCITGNLNITPGSSTVLYATCDQTNVSYKWGDGSTADSIVTGVLNDNREYSLSATNKTTKCVGQTFVTVMVNEGIESAESDNVRFYPNPTSGKLNIECAEGIANMAVYNLMGQRIMNSYNMAAKSSVDLSMLANGTYTMRIQLNNGNVIVRNVVISK